MKKLLIILMVVAMASFLFVGCLGVTPELNQAPSITSTAITSGKVGVAYTYDVDATDPDEDILTYSLTEKPLGMAIVATTGVISWIPTDAGSFAVGIKVSDPAGLSDVQGFKIAVAEADEEEPEPEIELTGIVVDPKSMTLLVGESEAIESVIATYEVRGSEVPIALEECTYTSSATGFATVSDVGLVTAVAEGTATITVIYGGKTDTLAVTVAAAPAVTVAVTGVTLDEATLALTVGDAAVTLVATVTPATATDTSVIWASSDETVAVVAVGVVIPLNAGISAIMATTVDGGFVATCVVTVTAAGEPTLVSTTPVIFDIQDSAETSIVSLTSTATQYINNKEAGTYILVVGIASPEALVQVYIDSATTPVAAGAASKSGLFSVAITETALGADSLVAKTLHVTSTELALIESAASNVVTFILDTDLPGIDSVAFTAYDGGELGYAEETGIAIDTFDTDGTEDEIEDGTWAIVVLSADSPDYIIVITGPDDYDNTFTFSDANLPISFAEGAPIPGVSFQLEADLVGAEHSEIVCTAEVDEIVARATLKFDEDVSYAAATATTCFYGGEVDDTPYAYKEAINTGYWTDLGIDVGISYTITVYGVKDSAGNVGGTEGVPLTKSAIAGAASETLLEP